MAVRRRDISSSSVAVAVLLAMAAVTGAGSSANAATGSCAASSVCGIMCCSNPQNRVCAHLVRFTCLRVRQ